MPRTWFFILMRAAVIKEWGSANVFEIEDIAIPEIGPDQVLIKINYSSVNPVDWKHRLGNHRYLLGAPFPIVLGYDLCGVIESVGTAITEFKAGDKVFGDSDKKYGGALAEYAICSENCICKQPIEVSEVELAGLPLVGLTALQALRDKAQIKAGNTVLINGASGGLGHVAVQIAKIVGADVTAVSSKQNHEFLLSLGCDECIDYKTENVLEINKTFDTFFDVHGNFSFYKTKHLLKKTGTYINPHPRPIILFHKLFQLFSNKKVKTLIRKHSKEDLELLKLWSEQGKLKIHIDQVFKLEAISLAHQYAEKGHTRGKNIITIKS